jgi:hypothetical protein
VSLDAPSGELARTVAMSGSARKRRAAVAADGGPQST